MEDWPLALLSKSELSFKVEMINNSAKNQEMTSFFKLVVVQGIYDAPPSSKKPPNDFVVKPSRPVEGDIYIYLTFAADTTDKTRRHAHFFLVVQLSFVGGVVEKFTHLFKVFPAESKAKPYFTNPEKHRLTIVVDDTPKKAGKLKKANKPKEPVNFFKITTFRREVLNDELRPSTSGVQATRPSLNRRGVLRHCVSRITHLILKRLTMTRRRRKTTRRR